MPAASSTRAVNACVALPRLAVAKDQLLPLTTPVPIRVAPSYTATTSPAFRVPVIVPLKARVLSLVLSPLATGPAFGAMSADAAAICGVAVGTRVSTLMFLVPAVLTLPAASLAVAERVSLPSPMPAMSPGTSV